MVEGTVPAVDTDPTRGFHDAANPRPLHHADLLSAGYRYIAEPTESPSTYLYKVHCDASKEMYILHRNYGSQNVQDLKRSFLKATHELGELCMGQIPETLFDYVKIAHYESDVAEDDINDVKTGKKPDPINDSEAYWN